MKGNAILLISCPDRRGLIAAVTDFVYSRGGSIEHADQHVDKERNIFFMRIEWSLENFRVAPSKIKKEFLPLGEKYKMRWDLYFSSVKSRAALFVSKELHCLYDLLYRYREGQFNTLIPLLISNHPHAADVAAAFDIDFKMIPITRENKLDQEKIQLKLLEDYNIDTLVLARYMQILTPGFVNRYVNRIINVHHSFLPAFAGARPYERAYMRGVKIIGATSHYVTCQLDEGPIIEQDVSRISHRDSLAELKRKGQDLEKAVLSRALKWHCERKVLVYGAGDEAKTVVFD